MLKTVSNSRIRLHHLVMIKCSALAFIILLFVGCSPETKVFAQAPPSHALWDSLLKKYVDEDGMVAYAAVQQDSSALNTYLDLLSEKHPNAGWTQEEELAYWVNAYNAFTWRLIIRNYPLESIKDITLVNIPFVHSPWDIKFIYIEGEVYDLNNIEHSIIRDKFDVPEIHFALVCAAYSCPRLRTEAYVVDKLYDQLADQAQDFIRSASKNQVQGDPVRLSKIFLWYRGDFTKNSSLLEFVGRYAPNPIPSNADVEYMDYDWRLNDQAKR